MSDIIDYKYLVILFFISATYMLGQFGTIAGRVSDDKNNPILGANVIIENTLLGTATDEKGEYKISNIPFGDYNISSGVIGYSKESVEISVENKAPIEINFIMKSKSYQIDQLLITANKYATDIKEIPASSYVLDQSIFSEKNPKQIDDALRYVPGITMVSDQISIRGSSGYGRGAGTRVLVAIDEIPIYTPDSGDIIWELVPISEIGRVEIIKGSVSSLYGSSAIGGIVNIITKESTSNPVTYVKFQGGVYSDPSHDEWKWNNRTLTFNSQTISHSRSIGKLGIAASITRFEDYSYRENDYQLRFAGFLKGNYHYDENTSLVFMATGYTRDKATYNYWKDIRNALSPPDADIGQFTDSDRTILGFTLNHIINKDFSISVIPNIYFSYWKDDAESRNRSNSKLYRSEIRANYSLSGNLNFISGTELQFNTVRSNIFGERFSNGVGIYTQGDYKPIDDINLSFGLRYDFNRLEDLGNTQSLSPKLGITYQYSDKTLLRGLASKGFRAPTLAEAFTSTTSAGITVKPNPDIEAETSYSFEIGVNQILTDDMSIDLSLFNNEYYEMIEPGFDPDDGQVFFNNVTRARIQGMEIVNRLSLLSNLEVNLGYTFLWPRDIQRNRTLNYRSKHALFLGMDFVSNFYQLGMNFRYLSRFENIDQELVDLGVIPDGDERVEIYVLDLNAGLNLFMYNIPVRLFINAKNLLNYNYVELIGNVAPIRNYSLNMEIIF